MSFSEFVHIWRLLKGHLPRVDFGREYTFYLACQRGSPHTHSTKGQSMHGWVRAGAEEKAVRGEVQVWVATNLSTRRPRASCVLKM